jgi:putative endonuclease
MSEKRPCVYILASKRNGALYVGVTSDIARRAWQHRSNAVGGFVRDYGMQRLVFVEFHETMADAILREKRIKKWRRTWKLELIERHNPQWRDLLRGAGARPLFMPEPAPGPNRGAGSGSPLARLSGNPDSEPQVSNSVVPAQAGTQGFQSLAPCSSQGQALGPRFRGGDDWRMLPI